MKIGINETASFDHPSSVVSSVDCEFLSIDIRSDILLIHLELSFIADVSIGHTESFSLPLSFEIDYQRLTEVGERAIRPNLISIAREVYFLKSECRRVNNNQRYKEIMSSLENIQEQVS